MAVSAAAVIDARTIAGDIRMHADQAEWLEVPTGDSGHLTTLVAPTDPTMRSADTMTVTMTRFIVDWGVDVNDGLDDAFEDMRQLPGWTEHRVERFPITATTEGGTVQAGTYMDESVGWLFAVTKTVLYQRGNVVYLLRCTGTTVSESADHRDSLAHSVRFVHLDD